ncbi:peptidylprolyl isomerase [Shouchella patagoniensis]|uniref:peptidylprolyl isomerase n=1 Tax=Shouchella patagoniensis TaxID=228576 RepID=UPI001FEB4443|nr:peptidylprolyl isomerase [Shouchella patagoniensis]
MRWKVILSFCVLFIFAACGNEEQQNNDNQQGEEATSEPGVPEVPVQEDEVPVVTMEMENGGIVKMELYPDVALHSVNNFVALIENGFYDGLTFHRIIPGFMVQGGDPEGTGQGGPGYAIKGEFSSNGIENNLSHERGILSMARSQDADSAGSQFFIMHEDGPSLDGDYAAFGKVIEGMEVIDQIAETETVEVPSQNHPDAGKPIEGEVPVIKFMTVERE